MKKKNCSGMLSILRTIPVLLLCVFISFAAFSGKNNDNEIKTQDKKVTQKEVEKMPEFPGGQEAMTKFIIANVTYPADAKKNGIQGKVFVSFTVTKTGKLDKIKVVKKVNELLDAEALRVISIMPNWIPGQDKGVAVDVEMTLPIAFKLN